MIAQLRPAIAFLGAALVLCVVGIVLLAALGRTIPDVLTSLAIADLTALAALLRPGDAEAAPVPRQPAPGA